jgi:hypothetical protein
VIENNAILKYDDCLYIIAPNGKLYNNNQLSISDPFSNINNQVFANETCSIDSKVATCVINLLFSQDAEYGPITLYGCGSKNGIMISNPPNSINVSKIPFGSQGFSPSSDTVFLENSGSYWNNINLGNFNLTLNESKFKVVSATGSPVCSNLFFEISPGGATLSDISIMGLTGASVSVSTVGSSLGEGNACNQFPKQFFVAFPNLTINASLSGNISQKSGFCGLNANLSCIDNPNNGSGCPFQNVVLFTVGFTGSVSLLQPLMLVLEQDIKNGPLTLVSSNPGTPSATIEVNNKQKDVSDVILQEITALTTLLITPIITILITSISGSIP